MSDQDAPLTATTAAPTMTVDLGPHAYALEPGPAVEDYPPTGATPAGDSRAHRSRWALSLAALLTAAAAFVTAGAHGARVLTTPTPAPVTVTLPPPDRNAEFLKDLTLAGIRPGDLWHGGTRGAVNNAYGACIELGTNGKTEADAVDWVQRSGVASPELFVKLAIKHYCPDGHL